MAFSIYILSVPTKNVKTIEVLPAGTEHQLTEIIMAVTMDFPVGIDSKSRGNENGVRNVLVIINSSN